MLIGAVVFLAGFPGPARAQEGKGGPAVIAYYADSPTAMDSFQISKVTHIIFSFCHLQGNQLAVGNARDSLTIKRLVEKKQENPGLHVLLSMGGWGGCRDCSAVFSTREGRKEFARSVRSLLDYFQADGIDLDWEYPAIAGFPGHQFLPEDRANFTTLVRDLRRKLGHHKLISFAAGGFTEYLEKSVDWKRVMRQVNFVNLMTYDLVGGYSTVTGHHTPLYSTNAEKESADHAVTLLTSRGVSPAKIALGAAFYGRVFDSVPDINHGLYQSARFKAYVPSKFFPDLLSPEKGFIQYWDDQAQAPFSYDSATGTFATYENARSIALKTKYVMDKKLFGIMFWQLTEDRLPGVLLDAIDEARKAR